MTRLLTALALLFLATPLTAQEYDDWYEVEIILFEHLDPEAIDEEKWPLDPGRPDLEGAIELGDGTDPGADEPETSTAPAAEEHSAEETATTRERPFQRLPEETLQLREIYRKLEASPRYRPLLHTGWRQIIQGRHRPDRIRIEADPDHGRALPFGTGPTPRLDEQGNVIDLPLDPYSAYLHREIGETVAPPPRLQGTITLSRGRYIHMETDLLWRLDQQTIEQQRMEKERLTREQTLPPPFAATGPANPDPLFDTLLPQRPLPVVETIRARGKLRTRSGELQYIDHPFIGVIVLFTPYAPPLEEEEEESAVETFRLEETL